MKLRISALMGSYQDDSVAPAPPPEVSPERIRELTMTAWKKRQRPQNRLLPRVLLCAALAGALAVSAVGVSRALGAGDIFAKDYADRGTPITEEQKQLISEMGTAGLAPVTSNGTTLTPLALLADEQVLYLRLHIEAPEGTVLPDLDPETDGYYQLSGGTADNRLQLLYSPSTAHTAWGWTLDTRWLPDDDPTDNSKDAVLFFQSMAGGGLRFNDGISKTLEIQGLWVQSPDKGYTRLLDGLWTFDVGLDCESRVVRPDAAGLERWDEALDCPVTLEELALSPLSLSWRISYPPPTGRAAPGPGLQVVMKDGSILEASAGPSERGKDYALGYLSFTAPIDLDQVACIQFGEHRIPLPE